MSNSAGFKKSYIRRFLPSLITTVALLLLPAAQQRAQSPDSGKAGGVSQSQAPAPRDQQPGGEPAYASSATVPQIAGISAQQQAQCLGSGNVKVSFHAQTGKLRFLGAEPWSPILQPTVVSNSASFETAARAYLAACGPLFGVNDQAAELVLLKQSASEDGRSMVRFQQVYKGIPVIAGELITNLDSSRNIISVNGETLPAISLDTVPAVDGAAAQQTALQAVAKKYGLGADALLVTEPELWVFNPMLVQPIYGSSPTSLVWRMEVKPAALGPIRELVLIDAHRGAMALSFNQIDNVKNRLTYTAHNGTTLPGTLVANESNPTCSGCDSHAAGAHKNAGLTYDFYFNYLGRNSIDNAGLTLASTVHYSTDFYNAFWNGMQMVYGDAATFPMATDVVAHELTHGVTQYTSNLWYFFQSGAINESLSDVIGEFVDQVYGSGNLNRWLMGQDVLPGGAIRDMRNPPAFGDPDKMTSPYYYTGLSDNGGVHWNSGVNNKAAYLLTEGGKFNGRTVQGIGITKAAKVYYKAMTTLLTSGSDYADLYDALYQGCLSLVGTSGITAPDCQNVRAATDAVEMNLQPVTGYNPEAPLCSSGYVPNNIFFDNLESGAGNWGQGAYTGTPRWSYDSSYGPFAHSGAHFIYGDDYPPAITDSYVLMLNSVLLPANAYLHFAHAFDFESSYDGGVVEYSTDAGATWHDTGALIDYNGYGGTIASGFGNPLAGRSAFVADSHGYISSRAALNSLAGQNVRFRWRMGLDSSGYSWGWWLDDVQIYTCTAASSAPPAPTLISPSTLGSDVIRTSTPTFKWNAVSTATHYELYILGAPNWQIYTAAQAGCANGIGICSVVSPVTLPAATHQWWVAAYNPAASWGPWSNSLSFTISLGPAEATLVSPSGIVTTSTPPYAWNAVSTATYYLLYVTNLSGPTTVINQWYTATAVGCPSGTGICSIKPATPLASGQYKWWIQTWSASGYGAWSVEMPFSVNITAPGTPTLVSPTGSISTSTPAYTWNALTGATMYFLWVDGPAGNVIQEWYAAAEVGCAAGTGTCIATPSTALSNGAHKWWIQGWNPAGYGSWSAPLAFTVNSLPPAATLVSPAGSVASLTPTYVWNAVPSATWYALWVAGPSGQILYNWYTREDAACPSGTGLCMVKPANVLAAGANYRFEILTWNPVGYGPWSSDSFFIVGNSGFDSEFNGDANGWVAHNAAWYVDSQYLWTKGLASQVASVSYTKDFSNFDYQAIFWRQGCAGCANRLIVRGTPYPLASGAEWNSGYVFQFSANGAFGVYRLVNGAYTWLQSWTFTTAINQGGAWNVMRVSANGGYMYLFINNQLVWSGSDSLYSSGRVGIGMYSDGSASDQLWMDWATLSAPGPAPIVATISPAQQALNAEANQNPRGTPDKAPEKTPAP